MESRPLPEAARGPQPLGAEPSAHGRSGRRGGESRAERARARRIGARRFLAKGWRLAACALVLAACRDGEDAMARGDRLWADSAYGAALAEYRLALQQAPGDESVLLRVAHGYATAGQMEEAREAYGELLARGAKHTDQAVFDYVRLARKAFQRGDRYGMAVAVEAALGLRPQIGLGDLAAPLARYYAENGEPARALPLYERALAEAAPDSAAEFLYEIGRIEEALGQCREAIGSFSAYRQRKPEGPRVGEARWHTGSCALTLARQAHRDGKLPEALEHLDLVLELGVPENVQDQAWFERGEILFAIGRFDEALAAYRRVLDLTPTRTGQLVERAQRRIDQIRFGT